MSEIIKNCMAYERRALIRRHGGDSTVVDSLMKEAAAELQLTSSEALRYLHDRYTAELLGYSFPLVTKPVVDAEDAEQLVNHVAARD